MAENGETTYPLRAASRLTGLSPELLRAWERRYAAVEPVRTEGGTRRYRASDVERLRLLKAAVDAGHRIGEIASLDAAELAKLGEAANPTLFSNREAVFESLRQFEAREAQRLLAQQLSALGATRFARDYALPLAHEVGDRWAAGTLSVASEHLATGLLRSLLGSALTPGVAASRGPRILFATLAGERHELGLQTAALSAMDAGANPIYLGAEVPVEDLLAAAEEVGAQVLALSMATRSGEAARGALAALRGGLPQRVRIWIGGAGTDAIEVRPGVEVVSSLEELEQRVALLDFEKSGAR